MSEEAVQTQREESSSIDLARSAKGEYSWHLKFYFLNGYPMPTIELLQDTDLELRERFLSLKPETT